jgi:hypothetical protein
VETVKQDANTSARAVVKLVATQGVRMTVREDASLLVVLHAQALVKILVVMAVHELVIK